MGLMEICRSRFKQSKNSHESHLMNLCYAVFCKLFGDFWVCLERNISSQRIFKTREIKNMEDLKVLK